MKSLAKKAAGEVLLNFDSFLYTTALVPRIMILADLCHRCFSFDVLILMHVSLLHGADRTNLFHDC